MATSDRNQVPVQRPVAQDTLKCRLMFTGVGTWRGEMTDVLLGPSGLLASGVQLGLDPLPYRLDYEVETTAQLVTKRLRASAGGDGWSRSLSLQRNDSGAWTCETSTTGHPPLRAPGGDMDALADALDCDLGKSPITNAMPVRRHELHLREGAVDFTMAWVSVPDLAVLPAYQRYEHLSVTPTGSKVRYTGSHRGFTGVLELDEHGIVLSYPEMAIRQPRPT